MKKVKEMEQERGSGDRRDSYKRTTLAHEPQNLQRPMVQCMMAIHVSGFSNDISTSSTAT